jgi:hypothetical protein
MRTMRSMGGQWGRCRQSAGWSADVDACMMSPPSGPNASPAPMRCAKHPRVARAKHAKHATHGRPIGLAAIALVSGTGPILVSEEARPPNWSAPGPGLGRPTDRRPEPAPTADRPAFVAGAHALRETPVCCSRNICNVWAADRTGMAHQAGSKTTSDACMWSPSSRPTALNSASAPMVATKHRRVARGNHGNHGRPVERAATAGRASGIGTVAVGDEVNGESRLPRWPTSRLTVPPRKGVRPPTVSDPSVRRSEIRSGSLLVPGTMAQRGRSGGSR